MKTAYMRQSMVFIVVPCKFISRIVGTEQEASDSSVEDRAT